jgi:hypothetical protein
VQLTEGIYACCQKAIGSELQVRRSTRGAAPAVRKVCSFSGSEFVDSAAACTKRNPVRKAAPARKTVKCLDHLRSHPAMDGNSPSSLSRLHASRTRESSSLGRVVTKHPTRWARCRSFTPRHRPPDRVWSSTAHTDSGNRPLTLLSARAKRVE